MMQRRARSLKLLFGILCVAIFASNLWSMSRWNERRGVADDLCYLRQAHLFQKYGLAGLSTDRDAETDEYFTKLVTETGHPEWDVPGASICHIKMADSGKRVIQYPPGPGFLLALFPEGFQVIPLHAGSTFLVMLMALVAIGLARSPTAVAAAGAFGCVSIYFMINPAKASYSISPTMVVCAMVGLLTALLLSGRAQRARLAAIAAIGVLLGLSVDFRIPNLLLSAGYLVWLLVSFVSARDLKSFLQGFVFGIAYLIGLAPTLLANAINAGSPLRTTYGGGDVGPPDFSFSIIGEYLKDIQGYLILFAIAWTASIAVRPSNPQARSVVLVTAINLAVNLAFFLSHPVFTQYYLMPLAMLSLWTLLFAYVLDDNERRTLPSMSPKTA